LKAAILRGPRNIEVRETERPPLDPEGFYLEVKASAICGSDIRAWEEGASGRGGIGHEVVGVIGEKGARFPSESPLKEGDRVIVAPVSCGKCEYCLSGNEHMCPERTHAGFVGPGGFSEALAVAGYVVAKDAVYQVPQNVSFETATLVEPLACVLNGQEKMDIGPGRIVAVIGGGPIGAMHAALSRYRGASRVFISDLHMERLKLISWVGADEYVDASRDNMVERVLEKTGGEGADCVIVACSNPRAQSDAVAMLKRLGEVLFFSGLPRGLGQVPLDIQAVHSKEITLKGSRNAGRRHFRLALRLLAESRLPFERLITHVLPLDEITRGFQMAAEGDAMKVVISF